MTREEIMKELKAVKEDIIYEECSDRGYNFAKVRKLNERKAELERMLNQ